MKVCIKSVGFGVGLAIAGIWGFLPQPGLAQSSYMTKVIQYCNTLSWYEQANCINTFGAANEFCQNLSPEDPNYGLCLLPNETQATFMAPSNSDGQQREPGVRREIVVCPPGFPREGNYCRKPPTYGRGVGYGWQWWDGFSSSGMFSRCEADNGPGRCEQYGAIVYPKCRANYTNAGSNLCVAVCPVGMQDVGDRCRRQ
jgi:hypothetical protein